MNLYQLFQTDQQHEQQGIVLDYGAAGKIRIARAGGSNAKFSRIFGERFKPYRRQFDNGTLDDGIANKVMLEVYADTVILGWEGVSGPEGRPLEYTRANVIQLLTDLPELFRDIQDQAGKAANFRAAELEADAKN